MRQSGNIFLTLFGAVALVAVLGSAVMNVLKGPVTSMVRVTEQTIAKNDMVAAAALISENTLARSGADCDHDGMVEPLPHQAPSGPAPPGGGWMPSDLGASRQDPWKRPYGYCSWDHGALTRTHNVTACGGGGAGRLNGAGNGTQTVIALISAGPNGIFETTCHDWLDADADTMPDIPLVDAIPGGDDIIRALPYGQFLMPSSAQAKLEKLPDEACTPATAGLMRLALGAVQVCSDTGWIEMAPASGGSLSFTPVTNAVLGSHHVSNAITLGAMAGPLPVSVSAGASLSINGGPGVTSGSVSPGDTLVLSGQASVQPETTVRHRVQIGAVTKEWPITTRDAYIAQLSITPVTSAMNVAGPGSPAYGSTVGFIVTNNGERATAPLYPAQLSNLTHFGFHAAGGHVGDDCAGKILQGSMSGSQSCIVDIRAKASGDGSYNGTLTVGDGLVSASASLSGTASGWNCPLPWGGKLANGSGVVAYATSCALLSCTSQVRTCTNGVLSGSYQHQTCNVLLSC